MNRLSTIASMPLILLFLGVALPSGDAIGQQKSLSEQIAGAWT